MSIEYNIKHYQVENIKCPECGAIHIAAIKNGWPFATFIYWCHKCDYTIMESEWETLPVVEGIKVENEFSPGNYVTLLAPVPKNYGHSIGFILLDILWYLIGKKPYDQFYYGHIDHKHDWTTNDNPVLYDTEFKWYYTRCRHYGCNVIHPIHD